MPVRKWSRRCSRRVGKKGLKVTTLRYFNAAGCMPDGSRESQGGAHLIPLVSPQPWVTAPRFLFGPDYDTRDGTCIRDYIPVLTWPTLT